MTGELILKNAKRWKQILPAVVLTALATFACVWPLMTRVQTGDMMMRAIMAALVTYILWRVLYPVLAGMMPGGDKILKQTWTLSDGTLRLNEKTIALSDIKMVHCWPNRDALGHQLSGWIVNIEMKGSKKNHILYSLDEGQNVDASVESLHQLVTALGYEARWVEE